jgi:hypothetical protein
LSTIEKAEPPAARAGSPTTSSEPQLNVILFAVGVSFILGAVIFAGSGQVSGLLFLVGISVGLALFVVRTRWVGALALLALATLVVGSLSGAWQAAATDLGIVIGAVVASAAAGSVPPARSPR